ncbi:hypothetical protein HMI56_003870 [Coelomomyces lativittatus]|nr:hypothetical protein HMI56_003870 [Coelomomyces lativittatus]
METTLLHSWNITSFSLRSSGKVGVKIMSQGLMAFNNQLLIKIEDDVQAKSDWTVVLEDLMCLHPFNFGLLQGSKTIQVKLNEQLVQVLQFHTPIKWCATNFFVYIVEDSLLKRFALLPLEHIISKLKEHHQYDACVDLIEASDLSRDDKRQFLHATRLENAYHLFKTNAYPEAMHWFKELCIPPSSIISLFPFFPFLSSLVEKLGGGGIPILGIEKTVSSTTPESKKILSRFLSDWRSMLNRLRLTFSDPQFLPFTNASIQASSSSLHSTSSSLLTKLSNEWNPEEVHREAIIIDTALLQLYLIENSDAMLGPLVRVKNLCDIEITTELLWSHQKYSQLIEFYQGKEMHGGALKTLKQLYSIPGTDASPYYKDLSSHFLYLHRLETIESEFPLIFDHLRWILEIDSKQALEFFYATTLPTQRVIDFLASNVPAYDVLNYIEHKLEMEVNEKNFDQDLHLHYLKYLVLGIQAEPENGSFTTKLRSHLEKESILVLGMAMGIIPDTFFEEQFILFKRTNETLKCFCLLIEKIQDLERAKSFVNEVGQFHNELILASHRSCDPKLQVLVQLYAEHLSLATLCQVLDANVCLKDIHSCLASAYARSQAALHQSILTRNLAGKEKTIYQLQLAKLHLGSVIIDDVVLCCICKKRIGTSAFVTWKDTRKVAHYGCQSSLMSR